MTDINLMHLPSRYDRPPLSLLDAVQAATVWNDLLTVTEVTDPRRAGVLFEPGWSRLRDRRNGLNEVALMVRNEVWEVLEYAAVQLGPDLGPGGIIAGIIAALRHRKTGRVLILTTAHLPATVEGQWRSKRAGEYRKAVQAWRRLALHWRRTYGTESVIAIPDWNMDLHKAWVRLWVASAWPGLFVRYRIPEKGSHAGGRLIDWPLTRGIKGVKVRVMPPHPHSDHNRVKVRGNLKGPHNA